MVACNSYEGELKADGVDYPEKKVMYCFRIDKIDDIIIILSLRLGQRKKLVLAVCRERQYVACYLQLKHHTTPTEINQVTVKTCLT